MYCICVALRDVCLGMRFCSQYTHTSPRLRVLRCIEHFLFLGSGLLWEVNVKSSSCETQVLGAHRCESIFFPEEALSEMQTFGFQFIVPTSIVCRWLKEALSRISIFGFVRCGFGSFLGGRSSHKRNSWGRLYPFQALSWVDFSGEALSRIQILGFHPPFGIQNFKRLNPKPESTQTAPLRTSYWAPCPKRVLEFSANFHHAWIGFPSVLFRNRT